MRVATDCTLWLSASQSAARSFVCCLLMSHSLCAMGSTDSRGWLDALAFD
eukprot:COSAG06_NODE_2021_length_7833_cov_3.800233_9_plen_49_part_01